LLSADVETKKPSLSSHERTLALVALQTFEGSFHLTPGLAALLGKPMDPPRAKLQNLLPNLSTEVIDRVWATLKAVKVFEDELASEKDTWELVVEKARSWMIGLGVNEADCLN
jgi:hypothetical protein